MSTLVTDLITRAAARVGDPRSLRADRSILLQFYNETQEEIATDLRVLTAVETFTVEAGIARYAYPDDMVQMRGLEYTPTPSDAGSYRWLKEYFTDEYRLRTDGQYPTGNVTHYLAEPDHFRLLGEPDVDVEDGGRITTWRVPAWLDDEAGALLELPDMMRTLVIVGMQPKLKRKLMRYTEADVDQRVYDIMLAGQREKIEDRSDDRRPAIRPNTRARHAGQV